MQAQSRFHLRRSRPGENAYPETPTPAAVQLVCIDADGEKADYANSQGNRVDKPKFGNAKPRDLDHRRHSQRQCFSMRGSCGRACDRGYENPTP